MDRPSREISRRALLRGGVQAGVVSTALAVSSRSAFADVAARGSALPRDQVITSALWLSAVEDDQWMSIGVATEGTSVGTIRSEYPPIRAGSYVVTSAVRDGTVTISRYGALDGALIDSLTGDLPYTISELQVIDVQIQSNTAGDLVAVVVSILHLREVGEPSESAASAIAEGRVAPDRVDRILVIADFVGEPETHSVRLSNPDGSMGAVECVVAGTSVWVLVPCVRANPSATNPNQCESGAEVSRFDRSGALMAADILSLPWTASALGGSNTGTVARVVGTERLDVFQADGSHDALDLPLSEYRYGRRPVTCIEVSDEDLVTVFSPGRGEFLRWEPTFKRVSFHSFPEMDAALVHGVPPSYALYPCCVASADGRIYIADALGRGLWVLDAQSLEAVDHWLPGTAFDALVLDRAARRLFARASGSGVFLALESVGTPVGMINDPFSGVCGQLVRG